MFDLAHNSCLACGRDIKTPAEGIYECPKCEHLEQVFGPRASLSCRICNGTGKQMTDFGFFQILHDCGCARPWTPEQLELPF